MANQNVFFVPATSLTTASVTLQTAAKASITYADNVYFMGVGGNVVSLKRQIEILDYWEWLCSLAQPVIGTPEFPRPAAAHLTALTTEMIATAEGWKHEFILISNAASNSDPFTADNALFFGQTGAAKTPFNWGPGMGSNGLQVAFEAMKKFALIGTSIWT